MTDFSPSTESGTSSSQWIFSYMGDWKHYSLSKRKGHYSYFTPPVKSQSVGGHRYLLNTHGNGETGMEASAPEGQTFFFF